VRQKNLADEVAAANGLGPRISYHRFYRVPPRGWLGFLLVFPVLCAYVLVFLIGWRTTTLLAAVVEGALAPCVLWPIRQGIRGVGLYDGGLVLLSAPSPVALPWAAISRVVYMETLTRVPSESIFRVARPVPVEWAFTQLYLRGETATVAFEHVWRHKRLARAIQAAVEH
jgi:hypothetical protein